MGANAGFGSFRHLAGRFLGSLDPRGPAADDEAWAAGWFVPGEAELWRQMPGADRRHAVGVAREVGARLYGAGGVPVREVMAAALLHDVGKVRSGLGLWGRTAVTVAAMAVGRDRLAGAARAYVEHDRIGAEMLSEAGSHPVTVAWAAEHHLPEARWSIDRQVGRALKEADGD